MKEVRNHRKLEFKHWNQNHHNIQEWENLKKKKKFITTIEKLLSLGFKAQWRNQKKNGDHQNRVLRNDRNVERLRKFLQKQQQQQKFIKLVKIEKSYSLNEV